MRAVGTLLQAFCIAVADDIHSVKSPFRFPTMRGIFDVGLVEIVRMRIFNEGKDFFFSNGFFEL